MCLLDVGGEETGGVSPFPEAFKASGLTTPMFNIYGDGLHMIRYPVNDREMSWGSVLGRNPLHHLVA